MTSSLVQSKWGRGGVCPVWGVEVCLCVCSEPHFGLVGVLYVCMCVCMSSSGPSNKKYLVSVFLILWSLFWMDTTAPSSPVDRQVILATPSLPQTTPFYINHTHTINPHSYNHETDIYFCLSVIKLKCLFFSGSGKTHTIEGELGEEKGVIPRAAEMVFQCS